MRSEMPDYMKNSYFSYRVINERTLAVFFPYDENPLLVNYSEVQRWVRILMEVYPSIESINVGLLDGDGVMLLCAKKEEYL